MKIWLVSSMQRLTRDSAMQQPITLGKSSSTLIPRSTFALSSLGAVCRECRHHASSIHRRDGSCQISETERVSLSSNLRIARSQLCVCMHRLQTKRRLRAGFFEDEDLCAQCTQILLEIYVIGARSVYSLWSHHCNISPFGPITKNEVLFKA